MVQIFFSVYNILDYLFFQFGFIQLWTTWQQLFFISTRKRIKASHDEQVLVEIKIYLAHDIKGFTLLFRQRNVSPEIINIICFLGGDTRGGKEGKNTLHGYSQLNYYLIHLADRLRSYLSCLQVCIML